MTYDCKYLHSLQFLDMFWLTKHSGPEVIITPFQLKMRQIVN